MQADASTNKLTFYGIVIVTGGPQARLFRKPCLFACRTSCKDWNKRKTAAQTSQKPVHKHETHQFPLDPAGQLANPLKDRNHFHTQDTPLTIPAKSPVFGLGTALLGFALFATHDVFTKYLGETYVVFQIIFFAMLFAFVPMAILMLADKQVDNFRPKHPWLVLLRACLSLIAVSCGFYAFTTLPLAEVYALLFAAPLLITIFAIPILGETVRLQRWAAVFVGLVGVLIVLRPGTSALTLGHVAALTSACAAALASVLVRKIGPNERPAVLILYPMILSMVIMGCLLPAIYVPVGLPHLGMMAAVGFLSVAAQYCVISGYRAAPAAVIAPMQYSQILWATAFGYLFFDEVPDVYIGLGSGIIIASGLFLVWRESRVSVSARNPVSRTPTPRFGVAPTHFRQKQQENTTVKESEPR